MREQTWKTPSGLLTEATVGNHWSCCLWLLRDLELLLLFEAVLPTYSGLESWYCSSPCASGKHCTVTISLGSESCHGTTCLQTGQVYCIRHCIGYRLSFCNKVIPKWCLTWCRSLFLSLITIHEAVDSTQCGQVVLFPEVFSIPCLFLMCSSSSPQGVVLVCTPKLPR